MYQFNFPLCKQARNANFVEHAEKVIEEALELQVELSADYPSRHAILEETMDVIHACEGLLYKFGYYDVCQAKDAVIAKNKARGYYE